MKTQIMIATLMAFALMFILTPLALAEINNTNATDCIGGDNSTDCFLTPTPILYSDNSSVNSNISVDADLNGTVSGWQITKAKIGLWFTFNQESKAEKELELAKLYLIEAKLAAKNNNTDAVNAALDAHNNLINAVQGTIAKIKEDKTPAGLKANAQKLIGLERAIQVHELRIAKLNQTLANANLTEDQRIKIENRMNQAENNTAKLSELEGQKQDSLKTKLIDMGNMTAEQADALIASMEQNHSIGQINNLIKDARQNLREENRNLSQQIRDNRNNISDMRAARNNTRMREYRNNSSPALPNQSS